MFIPGLPADVLTDAQIRTIEEFSQTFEQYSMFLALLFSMFGIWFSQYRYIASLTGGPGAYTGRICVVLLSLIFYKYLIWLVLSIAMFLGNAITEFTTAKVNLQQPLTFSLGLSDSSTVVVCQNLLEKSEKIAVTDLNKDIIEQYKENCRAILKNYQVNSTDNKPQESQSHWLKTLVTKSIKLLPFVVVSFFVADVFQFVRILAVEGVTLIILAILNIVITLSFLIVGYLWLIFVVLLYLVAPIVIAAGLLPFFGEKMAARWFYALIQCALWYVLVSFAGTLLVTFQLANLERLVNSFTDYILMSADKYLITSIQSSVPLLASNVIFLAFVIKTPAITARMVPEPLVASIVGLIASKTVSPFLRNTARAVDTLAEILSLAAKVVGSAAGTPVLGTALSLGIDITSGTICYALNKTAEMFDEQHRFYKRTTSRKANSKTGTKNISNTDRRTHAASNDTGKINSSSFSTRSLNRNVKN